MFLLVLAQNLAGLIPLGPDKILFCVPGQIGSPLGMQFTSLKFSTASMLQINSDLQSICREDFLNAFLEGVYLHDLSCKEAIFRLARSLRHPEHVLLGLQGR